MRLEKIEVDFNNKILQVVYNQQIENDEKVQLKNYDNTEDMVRELCVLLRKEMNRDSLFKEGDGNVSFTFN